MMANGKDQTDTPPLTGAVMCQVISRWLKDVHGVEKAPAEIWDMSPTGELGPVVELYNQAKADGYTA